MDGFTEQGLIEFSSAWGHEFVALIVPAQSPPVGITSKYEIKNTGAIVAPTGRAVQQCEVNGIRLIVLHFFPESDRQKISAVQNGEAKAVLAAAAHYYDQDCLILGDFNALSGDDRTMYGEKNNLDYSTIALFLDQGWVDLVRRQNNVPFMQATYPTRVKK